MRYILVKDTTVVDWNDETPYEPEDKWHSTYELEDEDAEFLNQKIEDWQEFHYDGWDWWVAKKDATIEEIKEKISFNVQDTEDIILLLAEILGTEEQIEEE